MTELIEEVTSKLSEKNLPVFYKYRYTFDKDENDRQSQLQKMNSLVKYITQHYLIGDRMVAGIEHYTKGMMTTKPHVHIHFMSRHSSDTIRKGIARYYEMIGRCQCCKAEVLVDEGKFWRYPLKQQKGQTAVAHKVCGFTTTETEVMIDIAHACWVQSAEILVGKIEKKLERSAKERLYVYLDSLDFAFESIKQVCCFAYSYFAEHEDTLCIKTVDSYVNIYLLQKKIITAEELYTLSHN